MNKNLMRHVHILKKNYRWFIATIATSLTVMMATAIPATAAGRVPTVDNCTLTDVADGPIGVVYHNMVNFIEARGGMIFVILVIIAIAATVIGHGSRWWPRVMVILLLLAALTGIVGMGGSGTGPCA